MHSSLNSMLLEDRRNQHMALQCHKNIYFDDQASLGHFCAPIVRPRLVTSRSEGMKVMVVPTTKTIIGSKAYSVRGPIFWKSLKFSIRCIEFFTLFKGIISKSAGDMFKNLPP